MIRTAERPKSLSTDRRQPIDCVAIIAAIVEHRARWPKWSPNHRATARWDVEIALDAELSHAKTRGSLSMVEIMEGGTSSWVMRMLPRERAAMNALNALRHASVSRRQIADTLTKLRAQMIASHDMTQSATYRLDWIRRAEGSINDLQPMLRRRRRDWHRFLELLAVYQTIVRIAA